MKVGDIVIRDDNNNRLILLVSVDNENYSTYPVEPIRTGRMFMGIFIDEPGILRHFFEPYLSEVVCS